MGTIRSTYGAIWHSLDGSVVAAYQAVSAPSYADSVMNVANHHTKLGNYTATPGVAPTWNVRTGWAGDDTAGAYLTNGLIPAYPFTVLCRVFLSTGQGSGAFVKFGSNSNGVAVGIGDADFGTTGYHLIVLNEYQSWGDTSAHIGTAIVSVVGMVVPATGTAITAYLNGLSLGTVGGTVRVAPTQATRLLGYLGDSGYNRYTDSGNYLSALAIYSRTLSAAEVWLASRQMAYCDVIPEYNAWARRRNYWIPAAAAGRVGIYGVRPTISLPGGVSIRPGTGVSV